MRVSNLQAMAYKNSVQKPHGQAAAAAPPTIAVTVTGGEGAYCVTAFGKAVQA